MPLVFLNNSMIYITEYDISYNNSPMKYSDGELTLIIVLKVHVNFSYSHAGIYSFLHLFYLSIYPFIHLLHMPVFCCPSTF